MADYEVKIENKVVVSGEQEIDRLGRELTSTKEQLDRVNSTLQMTRSQLSQVQAEFNNFSRGNGIDILQAELDRFRNTASTATEEFRSFLSSVNLNDAWGNNNHMFDSLFKEIEQGSKTASQAILEVKTQYRALMEENYNNSGGLFDTQTVQQFTATLEQLSNTMNLVLEKVTTFEREGVKAVGDVGSVGGGVASILKQIETATAGMTTEAKNAYEPITKLLGAMTQYASLSDTKLLGVSQAFRNIADIGTGSYGTKSIENIVYLAQQLQTISANGTNSIRFDFTGLNELHVSGAALKNLAENLPKIEKANTKKLKELSDVKLNNFADIKAPKAALSNLAAYLPTISKVNVERLKELQDVNLSNFNNISVSKASMEAIANLTTSLQILKETKAAVANSGNDAISIDVQSQAKSLEKLFQQYNSTSITKQIESFKASWQGALQTVTQINSVKDTNLAASMDMKSLNQNLSTLEGGIRTVEGLQTSVDELFARFRAGEDVTSELTSRLQLLQGALSKTGSLASIVKSQVSMGKGSAKMFAELDTNKVTKDLAAVNANYEKLKSSLEGLSGGAGKFQGLLNLISADLKTLGSLEEQFANISQMDIAELNEKTALYESTLSRVKNSISALNTATRQTIKEDTAEQKKRDAEATKAQTEALSRYSKAISDYYSLQQQVAKNGSVTLQGDNWVASRQEYEKTAEALNNAKTEFNNAKKAVESLGLSEEQTRATTEQLNKAARDLAITEGNTAAKSSDAEATKAQTEAYNEAIRTIDNFNRLRQQALQSGGVELKGSSWTALRTELEPLATALREAQTAADGLQKNIEKSIMTDEQKAAVTNRLTEAEKNYAIAQGRAKASSNDAEVAAKTTAYKQYYSVLEQLEKALRNYSAAEHSSNQSSRTAYAAIKTQYDTMKSYKSEVDNSKIAVDKLKTATDTASVALARNSQVIKENGNATQSFLSRFGELSAKFGSWFGITRVIMYVIRSIRQMISASIELDSAMAQMQIVTKATESQMNKFADSAANAAQRIGSSITDFMSSATTFARLGYSMDESNQLAEFTAMLQNVGDIDVSEAQDAITSIVKAFDVDTDKIESVMDKLVATGNAFPISVSQIAEGMTNASSALAAAGNSFEQSVALLTAANTTINLCRAA